MQPEHQYPHNIIIIREFNIMSTTVALSHLHGLRRGVENRVGSGHLILNWDGKNIESCFSKWKKIIGCIEVLQIKNYEA